MKKQITLSFVLSLLVAVLIGVAVSLQFETDPQLTIATAFIVRTGYYFIFGDYIPSLGLFAGINKEIWTDKLKEVFWAEGTFLDGVDDWSEWVENNTINFTNMGADPVVLKNNAVWPIVAVQRTDTNGTVVLDTYDTTTTRVRNVEEIEASINKLESVIKQHRMKLQMDIQSEALWNYSPTGPTSATAPVVDTTGATRSITIRGGTLSSVGARCTLENLSTLQEQMDNQDFPEAGRTLVLCPTHRKDLMDQDATLFKQFSNLKAGQFLDIFGFKVTSFTRNPVYHKTTKVKAAYGAAFDATNDVPASIAFIKQEVMKCMGTVEVFHKEKGINPEQRADEIGFQMRAKCVNPRGQNAIGAIITARA
jgi:hypothetical protein